MKNARLESISANIWKQVPNEDHEPISNLQSATGMERTGQSNLEFDVH